MSESSQTTQTQFHLTLSGFMTHNPRYQMKVTKAGELFRVDSLLDKTLNTDWYPHVIGYADDDHLLTPEQTLAWNRIRRRFDERNSQEGKLDDIGNVSVPGTTITVDIPSLYRDLASRHLRAVIKEGRGRVSEVPKVDNRLSLIFMRLDSQVIDKVSRDHLQIHGSFRIQSVS